MAEGQQSAVEHLTEHRDDILDAWVAEQAMDVHSGADLLSKEELRRQSGKLLDALIEAVGAAGLEDLDAPQYAPLRALVSEIALRRQRLGAGGSAMAKWILSLRDHWVVPLLSGRTAKGIQADARRASRLIDALAMAAYEEQVRRGESTIRQQAEEILEISTPVIKVWDGVVAAPLIGALDSDRTQRFMERLLETIAATNSPVALVDITGVPTIDTQTAQHLIDTVSAVRLLGSRVILTGVRPSIAQTLVHLGISMSNITTRSSFAGGLRVAMEMLELEVTPTEADA